MWRLNPTVLTMPSFSGCSSKGQNAAFGSILALLVVFQLPETGGRSKGGRTSFVESYMQLLTDRNFWA